ncbi:MAG TPA: exosortase/archaeosortase family protein [Candidatus Saccharimonadales bacterium]|nr:exosortase/archaeosortase family protein [Candidatus Saccharimonadales bacterium]
MDAIEHTALPSGQSLGQEFFLYWNRLPKRAFFFGLLAAWCLLFYFFGVSSFNFSDTPSLFQWMYNAWNAPALDSSQGNLVLPAVIILLWVRREQLAAVTPRLWWPALFFVAMALALHAFGFLVQQPRASIVALFLGLYGLVGLAWGWEAMKATFFPFILFAFCMPFGTFIENLTLPLRLLATDVTYGICHGILGINLVQQGTTLTSPDGRINYDIAVACSGIRSFFALLGLSIVFSVLTLQTAWKRAVMILLTIPLVVFCNILRLTAIVLATQAFDRRAGDLVHHSFGFLTYAVAVGGLMIAGHWLKDKSPSAAR